VPRVLGPTLFFSFLVRSFSSVLTPRLFGSLRGLYRELVVQQPPGPGDSSGTLSPGSLYQR
jgi:hypothetical protein